MYNENKYTEIYIKIRSKFEKKSIESILNCGLSLNLEYYLRMDSLDKSLIIQHLLDLSNDNAYQFRILYKESGFDLRFFRSSEGWFSIRCYYFADFLTTKADYEECDEQVFDTIKYLEIVVFLCKYLVIERIRVVDDEESEAIQLTDPVQNTVSVRTGSTYYLRSPYQYLIMVLNNIIDSGGRVASESEDINEAARNLAGYLTEQPETGVSLIFALQDQNFELRIYRENLVLKSLDSLKIKTDNDIEFVDVAYYTEIMMKLCKDLGIRDLQTYFE